MFLQQSDKYQLSIFYLYYTKYAISLKIIITFFFGGGNFDVDLGLLKNDYNMFTLILVLGKMQPNIPFVYSKKGVQVNDF